MAIDGPPPASEAAVGTTAAQDDAPPEPPVDVVEWPCRWSGCSSTPTSSHAALLEHVAQAHCVAPPASSEDRWRCHWGACERVLPTARALLAHVQPHLPQRGLKRAGAEPDTVAAPTVGADGAAGAGAGRAARFPGAAILPKRHKHADHSGSAFLAALTLQNLVAVPALRAAFVSHQTLLLEWTGSASRLAPYTAIILAELLPRT